MGAVTIAEPLTDHLLRLDSVCQPEIHIFYLLRWKPSLVDGTDVGIRSCNLKNGFQSYSVIQYASEL